MSLRQGTKAVPNPMYNAAYGNAPTYPIFWARHVNQLLTSPLMLVDLFLVSGVSYNTSEPPLALSCSHPRPPREEGEGEENEPSGTNVKGTIVVRRSLHAVCKWHDGLVLAGGVFHHRRRAMGILGFWLCLCCRRLDTTHWHPTHCSGTQGARLSAPLWPPYVHHHAQWSGGTVGVAHGRGCSCPSSWCLSLTPPSTLEYSCLRTRVCLSAVTPTGGAHVRLVRVPRMLPPLGLDPLLHAML